MNLEEFKKATEGQLRDGQTPRCETYENLLEMINIAVERPHDYGTCCYAMSMCAEAVFNYIGHRLGVTGFQASCADTDFIRRTRGFKFGFRLVDYNKLLYPQYTDDLSMSADSLLADRDTRETIRAEARRQLEHADLAHKDVIAHWRKLVDLPTLLKEPS